MSDPIDSEGFASPELASLLDALAQPPLADELVDEAAVVASMQSVVAPAGTTQGASMTPALKRFRLAALAAVGLTAVGGVAAAEPGGFDPSDRPPAFEAPPASGPPVELPDAAKKPATTSTTAPTTTVPAATTTSPATTTPPTTAAPTTTTATTVAPGEVVCAEGPHGETVSSVARATPPGPEHGPTVAIAAQSDCGKAVGETTDPDDATTGPPVQAPEDEARDRGRPDDAGRPTDAGRPADSPANSAPGRAGADRGGSRPNG